jgi:hypothetical protein
MMHLGEPCVATNSLVLRGTSCSSMEQILTASGLKRVRLSHWTLSSWGHLLKHDLFQKFWSHTFKALSLDSLEIGGVTSHQILKPQGQVRQSLELSMSSPQPTVAFNPTNLNQACSMDKSILMRSHTHILRGIPYHCSNQLNFGISFIKS